MIRGAGWIAAHALVALVLAIGMDLLIRGVPAFELSYLWESPRDLGRRGGIGPILISTFLIVGGATFLAALVSLPAAIAYTEIKDGRSALKRLLSFLLNIGVGIPRIIWGLCGALFFGGILGFGYSVATGVLTLTCLLSPIMTLGFISGLQSVDRSLWEQCQALGVTRWQALWSQIIRAARPTMTATMALALGRGCGDAAALVFTSGVAMSLPTSVFDSASTLAVFIFHLLSSVPGGQNAAYAAAAVLFLVTLGIQMSVSCYQGQIHERFSQ